ncbi:uncharacterized protein PHALS_05871 [Plasmopara halstedii]|uniref:Uncharacterized protein n=1 Tax=Plasmopara halstedii TaxID=4781 RepID=A0A0P1AAL0_PLAHL|nr:uncharacterized protein PHALS_05871 [Plasmopara halstedii]CEG37817.1 hypothetical protein PHALS_05871 [Plasmopara halstedii]|eukprot:XP_024574186.1 hypothetical protein PHALS_05871 [Plasmopara halstedii]
MTNVAEQGFRENLGFPGSSSGYELHEARKGGSFLIELALSSRRVGCCRRNRCIPHCGVRTSYTGAPRP